MRLFTTCLFALAVPVAAHASRESFTLKDVNVLSPVTLIRADGKPLTITRTVAPVADLGLLPAPTSADQRLCEGRIDKNNTAEFLRQTDLLLKLTEVSTKRMYGSTPIPLTAQETALLRTVPHCAPFLTFLSFVARNLSAQPEEPSVSIGGLAFNAGFLQSPKLELSMSDVSTDANDKAIFKLPGLRSWSAAQIPANATGQNISVRIDDLGEDNGLNGGPSEGYKSCTAVVTRCDRGGDWRDGRGPGGPGRPGPGPGGRDPRNQPNDTNNCHVESVPGHQHYVYDPTYYEHSWRLTFADPSGNPVLELTATTQRTTDSGNDGPCIPDRPDWGGHR